MGLGNMDSTLLYCDLYQGTVCKAASGTAYSFPTLTAGGRQIYSLRFIEYTGSYQQVYPEIAAVRIGMGYKDMRPTRGTYQLKASGGVSTAENTTPPIPFDATFSTVASALNALPIAAGNPFVCTGVTGGYMVSRTDGSVINLSIVGNKLLPISFGVVDAEEFSGSNFYQVRLRQAPLAFTDGASLIAAPAPKIAEVQAGGVSPDGITKWNEVQSLTINPNFQGTYQLRRNFEKTILLDITDGATQLQNALNAMLAPEGGRAIVTNPTSNVAYIEFGGTLSAQPLPLLNVQVFAAPPGDLTFTLDLGTVEMLSALRDAAGANITIPFEAEADFYISSDHSLGTVTRKLWSTNVTIQPPLIFPALASVDQIDWVKPPTNTYVPFAKDQIITGQQSYTTTIGDGSTTVFHVIHNLQTANLSNVLLFQNAANGTILRIGEDYTLEFDSASQLTVAFAAPPSPSSIAIVITAAGPTSVFQAHTHTIAQITNLQTTLDSLGGMVAYLMSLVPSQVIAPAATSASPNAVNSVASFGEILPDASLEDSPLSISSQVMTNQGSSAVAAVPGTDLQEQLATNAAALVALQAQLDAAKKAVADATAAGATIEEAKAIAAHGATAVTKTIITVMETLALGTAALPVAWPPLRKNQPPTLLRALAGTAVNYTAITPPNITPAAVYRTSGGITLPSSLGRKAAAIPAGGYFASDGDTFYPVYLGGDSLWHPVEMDREIARVAISSRAFPAGSNLEFSWSTTALLSPATFDSLKTDLFARYSLQVLAIPASPSLVSAPVVLASTELSFSQSRETRSFSLAVSRPDGEGESKTTLTSYGVKQAGAPFPSGDVVLVIALKEFETDSNPPSTGQLSLHVPPSQLTISK